jgi:hypothetical protein
MALTHKRPDDRKADVGDVRGLWRRTVYRRGNEEPDASDDVYWMQGPRFFADIRQPSKAASFKSVGCLRDLEPEHLAQLARQQAFAGTLALDGNLAWWQRTIDLHPQGPFEDRARLQQSGEVIDEFGVESHYFERWERQNLAPGPCWGLRLQSVTDRRDGFLVRVADKLMFARGRAAPLPPGRNLAEILGGIRTHEGKQDLLDFEVSLGCLAAGGWLIERSTLPFKQGKLFSIVRRAASIEIGDLDPRGAGIVSAWRIVDGDSGAGDLELQA